ncbi:MAG: CAP domain-containing protein [Myxococcota bacterium]
MVNVRFFIIILLLIPSSIISEEKLQFTNTYNPRVFSYTLKKEESNLFSLFINSSQGEYKEMFEIDARLCAAARYNSNIYAKKGNIPKRIETTALRPLLWSYGIYDFQFLPTAFAYWTEESLKDSLKSYLHIISRRGFFNCGIGISEFKEEKKIATIICTKRVVEAFDIPKIMTVGSYLNLNFTIRTGYKDPILYYSPPSGDVTRKRPAISEKGEYFDSYPLDGGEGKYLVQIMVRGENGVEPAFLIPIYTGVPIGDIKRELQTYINLEDNTRNVSPEEAKEMLYKAINYERKKMRRGTLILNPILSKIAQEKSKMMAEKQLFGHEVTEKRLEDMLKANNIKFSSVAENIGLNSSPRMAHFLFMSSPAHRGNILNSIYNEVGIGVYKAGDEDPQWFITEIFIMSLEF